MLLEQVLKRIEDNCTTAVDAEFVRKQFANRILELEAAWLTIKELRDDLVRLYNLVSLMRTAQINIDPEDDTIKRYEEAVDRWLSANSKMLQAFEMRIEDSQLRNNKGG